LPELLTAEYVFVAEGEKDVDALCSIGLRATCNPGGAGKWRQEYTDCFKSHQHVTIIPDNDEPGRRHATDVAASLLGKVGSVRILALPGLPDKGDVSDWLTANPDDAAEELARMSEAAPEWRPESDRAAAFDLSLVMSAAAFVEMPLTPREDIIRHVMYTQSANAIVGPRGLGKTRVVATLGNAVSKGEPFFAWETVRDRRFLLVDGELPAIDLKSIIYDHCGGAPSPYFDLISSEFFNKAEGRSLTLNDPEHQVKLVGLLDELERKNRRPELIAFDNLSAMSFGLDENDNSAQDGLLQFLIHLRHRGYATLLVQHTGWSGEHARGASRREDFLDLSIALKPLAAGPVPTCQFKMEFAKVRRKPPSPLSLECVLTEGCSGYPEWSFRSTTAADSSSGLARVSKATGEANLMKVDDALTGIPQSSAYIAEHTGLSKSTVVEHLGTLKKQNRAAMQGSGRKAAWFRPTDTEHPGLGRLEETC
jgi:hypothetical protein